MGARKNSYKAGGRIKMKQPGKKSYTAITTAGTEATRRFYEETGWRVHGGKPVDLNLFGAKEDGPIRIELHRRIWTDFDRYCPVPGPT